MTYLTNTYIKFPLLLHQMNIFLLYRIEKIFDSKLIPTINFPDCCPIYCHKLNNYTLFRSATFFQKVAESLHDITKGQTLAIFRS